MKASSNRSNFVYVGAFLTCLFFQDSCTVEARNWNITANTTTRECGGEIIVGLHAQILNSRSNGTLCHWVVRARHPTQRIGVAVVGVTYQYHSKRKGGIYLTIVDSFTKDHFGNPRFLKKWNAEPFEDFMTNLKPQVISQSNQIEVNYTRFYGGEEGNEIEIDFSLLVFVCGGDALPNIPFRNPILSYVHHDLLPEHLWCKWCFEKPMEDQLYTLKVSQFEGQQVYLNISKQDGTFYNMSTPSLHLLGKEESGKEDYDPLKGIQKPRKIPHSYVLYCDECNYTIAFSSKVVEVYFSVVDLKGTERLNATFSRHPVDQGAKAGPPFYLNYINLVVFVPIGLLLGMIFIIYQRKNAIDGPPTLRPMKNKRKKHAKGAKECAKECATFLNKHPAATTTHQSTSITSGQKSSSKAREDKLTIDVETTAAAAAQPESHETPASKGDDGTSDKRLLDRALKRVSFR